MYVTPSAVSTSIARLEGELGVRLFDRVGRNMKLNQYGRIYKDHVDQVFKLLDDATQALASEKNKARTNISVAVRAPVLWLPIFNDFRNGIHKFSIMTKSYWGCL